MFNITGEKVKVWVNNVKSRNGDFQTFSVSFSKKADGEYINKSVKLFIGKDVEKPVNVKNGTLVDFEGFPTLDIYTDKDGNERREVALFATHIDWHKYNDDIGDVEGYAEYNEPIPF